MGLDISNPPDENLSVPYRREFPVFNDFRDLSSEKNFSVIPEIALRRIFLYLQPKEIPVFLLTCRYFEKVARSNLLWKLYHRNYFKFKRRVREVKEKNENEEANFRELFFKHFRAKHGFGSTRPKFVKIVTLGDPEVGKTCFVERYVDNTIPETYKETWGADFKMKDVIIGSEFHKLQLWDTRNENRPHGFCGDAFLRGTDGWILMFDLSRFEKTFMSCEKWRQYILDFNSDSFRQERNGDCAIIVVGNKSDLKKGCELSEEQRRMITEYCDRVHCKYVEISVKENIGLDEVIEDLLLKVSEIESKREKYNFGGLLDES